MVPVTNFKKLSFLVYGLGLTGRSVVNFFKKNNIKVIKCGMIKIKIFIKIRRPSNLNKALKKVDYIVLSPGVNIKKIKNKLPKYKKNYYRY